MPLDASPVFFLDCQTTGTQPSTGEVIELGWALHSAAEIRARGVDACAIATSLIAPSPECGLSPTVQKITGLRPDDLVHAPGAAEVWQRVLADLPAERPVRAVIHYARFEKPFLAALNESAPLPFEIFCTYQIAKKLIPGLPSSTLRAVSGHFGRVLGEAHRAEDHVRATLWIWQHVVEQLGAIGITEWEALSAWLSEKPAARKGKTKRHYLLPREKRLALPAQPGVYRMLSRDGKLLYVGKATSLRDRVNSYFRTRTTTRTRMPEMMAQVHDIDVTPLETSVEAALLETDEIKKWNPPYNASLRPRGTRLTYWSRDFERFQFQPDEEHPWGPFAGYQSIEMLGAFGALILSGEDEYGLLPHIDDTEAIAGGAAIFRERYRLHDTESVAPVALLNLGARLPERETSEEEDETYTAEDVATSLENGLRRTAAIAQRARWLCRLTDAELSWRHGPQGERRVLHFADGKWTGGEYLPPDAPTPVPAQWRKGRGERQACFDLTTYDRLAVLLAEIRRLVGEEREVQLRLSPDIQFGQSELKRWL